MMNGSSVTRLGMSVPTESRRQKPIKLVFSMADQALPFNRYQSDQTRMKILLKGFMDRKREDKGDGLLLRTRYIIRKLPSR